MKGKGRYQIWLTLGIFWVFVILPFAAYGASLTIGNTVSVNGNMNATSFSGDGSGLTNVGGNSTCTPIPSLPQTITASGVYCLTSDLSTNIASGDAVTINTDSVVIDLNGHKLDGLPAGAGTQAYGIYASQKKDITIRNGTIRGFFAGIGLVDSTFTTSQGHLIEDIRADMNTTYAMYVVGRGNIIRNNQVVSTGGSTIGNYADGIFVLGPGPASVLNNDVIETLGKSGGGAFAIVLNGVLGGVAENNRIGNSSFSPGTSNGIAVVGGSADVLVSNNRVTTMTTGIYFDGTSTGLYMNNLVAGCTNAFSGGTAAGTTNYSIP